MNSLTIHQIAQFLQHNPQVMAEILEIQDKLKNTLPCKLFAAKVLTKEGSAV